MVRLEFLTLNLTQSHQTSRNIKRTEITIIDTKTFISDLSRGQSMILSKLSSKMHN